MSKALRVHKRLPPSEKYLVVIEYWYRVETNGAAVLPTDICKLMAKFAVLNGGICYAIGYNYQGECGVGDNTKPTALVRLDWTDSDHFGIADMSHSGDFFSVFLTTNGDLWGCGQNNNNQLLISDGGGQVKIPAEFDQTRHLKFRKLNHGVYYKHVLAITELGEVYAWGNNTYKQTGINTSSEITTKIMKPTLVPFPSPKVDIVDVGTGSEHSIFLAADGRVFGTGQNTRFQCGSNADVAKLLSPKLIQYFVDNNVKIDKIGIGGQHSTYLDSDGQVWVSGENSYGQLAVGSKERIDNSKRFPNGGPLLVTYFVENKIELVDTQSGGYHTIVVSNDGCLYGWGRNGEGQLGIGTTGDGSAVHKVQNLDNEPMASVRCGNLHCLAVSESGHVYGWGANGHGQSMLDKTDTADVSLPRKIKTLAAGDFLHVHPGRDMSMVVKYT